MKWMLGMWGRSKVTVLAVVVAMVLVAAPAALAANGGNFILGKANNVATAVTGLIGKVASGPALLVKNPSGGPALDLQVNAGKAPMTVNSSTRVANLNADKLDGLDYSWFMRGRMYKTDSVPTTGNPLGDGTYSTAAWCDEGDFMISGGPANIDPETDLLESMPSPPLVGRSDYTWTVRVNKNGFNDEFNVVVLCVDQWNP